MDPNLPPLPPEEDFVPLEGEPEAADAPPAEAEAFDEPPSSEGGEGGEGGEGAEQPAGTEEGAAAPAGRKRAPRTKVMRPRRQPVVEAPKPTLAPEFKAEAREATMARLLALAQGDPARIRAALELIEAGRSLVFIERYRKKETRALDLRSLRALREDWHAFLLEEEHRVGRRELLRQRGGLTPEREAALQAASSMAQMDDIAAYYLPVPASRATVARGMGLEGLAEAIRKGEPGQELSALAQPFVKPGGEPASLDLALGGARDILAEELVLDVDLRASLRELYYREALLTVNVRPEKRNEAGRHAAVLGPQGLASRVPALKLLAVRRGERERALSSTIEPPEELALGVVHQRACAADHVHAGFLRAAAEDGYRRILKPMLQADLRTVLKARADRQTMETFERTLKNLLLGPVGGARRTLGVRPDVTMGHRWCAVDGAGLPTGSGQLPHEPTAGREAVLAELREVLRTYEVEAVAIGSSGGRAEALSLVREALGERASTLPVVVVGDGGLRAVEALPKLSVEDRPEVPTDRRGALSLARRFQDPLAELLTLDVKALALGPHMHDVHQGQLRALLDETASWCVGHAGVDAHKASVDVLAHLPGFDTAKARAFDAYRASGPLPTKAVLATIEGVGPEAALEAVGFLRLPAAADPRDRTQLHPEHYGIVDEMAQQLGLEVPALLSDLANFDKLDVKALETPERPLPLLHEVLWTLAETGRDPRPPYAQPIAPPPGTTLATLRPGLALEGRVMRVAPFGVFVDVGLEEEGLLPVPHIGDHPGADQAVVAPLGAVITVRVLEVIPEKRRLALTMRSESRLPRPERGPERGGDRGPRGPRGPRREGGRDGGREMGRDLRPEMAGAPAGAPPAAGGPPADARRGERRGREGERRGRDERGPGRPRMFSAAEGQGGHGPAREERRPPRKTGGPNNAIGGAFGGRNPEKELGLFERGFRDESGAPRRISLKPDEPAREEAAADEAGLTQEQLLAKKLAELAAKFGRK